VSLFRFRFRGKDLLWLPGISSSDRISCYLYLSAWNTHGSRKFPNYPFEYMPCSQTPVETLLLAMTLQSLLPSTPLNGVGFHS